VIWVIDASVALRWFIQEDVHSNADHVLKKLIDRPESCAVLELFAFEVYAVLQRLHPFALEVFRQGLIPFSREVCFVSPCLRNWPSRPSDMSLWD
jgi:predicted nucleic acid-binding protein